MKLTKRQKQILDCLSRGLNNRQIAQEMNLKEQTVKSHLWLFFKKIGVDSRLKALAYARANGWMPKSEFEIDRISAEMYRIILSIRRAYKIQYKEIDDVLVEYEKFIGEQPHPLN